MELDDGQPGLQIKMKIYEISHEANEKDPVPDAKSVSLVFRNKGLRFFATKKTQGQLNEISALTRKMLE